VNPAGKNEFAGYFDDTGLSSRFNRHKPATAKMTYSLREAKEKVIFVRRQAD